MLEKRVIVQNTLGLHARAAAQLVKLSSSFASRITIIRVDNSASASAKSILELLALAAAAGTELILQVEGEDERDGAIAVEALITEKFGEM